MGLVCGVGIYCKGKYQSKIGQIRTREYELCRGVIKRCYDIPSLIVQPAYADCEVSDSFKNFQLFSEWCNDRDDFKNIGWHLDKDILVRGNKIYSENTCCFVPKEINMLFTKRTALRGENPIGVNYHKGQKKYNSRLMIEGKKVQLGSFTCPIEAFEVYKQAKEINIKNMADRYYDRLMPEVYDALCSYEVNIND